MRIEKKLHPNRFEQVMNGTKKSDIRLADFEARPGDMLVLREWDPEKEDYTGRILEKEIASVVKTKQLPLKEDDVNRFGFQILSFLE